MAASMWESIEKDKNAELATKIAERALGLPEFQELKKLEDKIFAVKRARELLSNPELFPEINEAKKALTKSNEPGQPVYNKPLDFIVALKIVNSLFPKKQK
jgi:hypothetical protein